MRAHGHVPLPPYIARDKHSMNAEDVARYQTVFAKHPGAAAAPTAALHFDQALLDALQAMGVHRASVTLACGCGHVLAGENRKLERPPNAQRVVQHSP